MKSALAIGGSSALAATTDLGGFTGTASAEHGIDFAERENRQHAWGAYLDRDERGLPVPPRYHVLLFVNYQGSGEPAAEDRREMEAAFQQLEAAFEWSNEGLLFTASYSLQYFDRFDDDLPAGVDLRTAQSVIDTISMPDEDPVAEPFEIVIDLASDTVSNLLAAEEALWGERDELAGVQIDATLEGIFDRPTEYPARRTGFVGTGAPAEEFDDDDNLSEDAPLSMGFESVFEDNIPEEDGVTMFHDQRLGADNPMPPGMFAQGSIQHASNLSIDLDSWYDQSHEERAARMYSPHHDSEEVGDVGEELGATSGTSDLPMRDADADDDIARRTQEDAEQEGVVGHAQKLARGRFDLARRFTDGEPDGTDDTTILRRDFNTADVGKSGLHFLSLMRFNGYLVYVRLAMNGVEFSSDALVPNTSDTAIDHDDVDIDLEDDGFLAFITALRRGNYLVPPLTLRSLPPANPAELDVGIRSDGDWEDETVYTDWDEVTLEVTGADGATMDPDSAQHMRFGPIETVNKAGGVPASSVTVEDGTALLTFDLDDVDFDDDVAKLLCIDEDGVPVQATYPVTTDSSGGATGGYQDESDETFHDLFGFGGGDGDGGFGFGDDDRFGFGADEEEDGDDGFGFDDDEGDDGFGFDGEDGRDDSNFSDDESDFNFSDDEDGFNFSDDEDGFNFSDDESEFGDDGDSDFGDGGGGFGDEDDGDFDFTDDAGAGEGTESTDGNDGGDEDADDDEETPFGQDFDPFGDFFGFFGRF